MVQQQYVTRCACDDVQEQVTDLENVILTERCARCGGTARTRAMSVYEAAAHLQAMISDLQRSLGQVPPPGRALVTEGGCPLCSGRGCPGCAGTGRFVMHRCIHNDCDGLVVSAVNGRDETDGLSCLTCHFTWAASDRRWTAQRTPGYSSLVRQPPGSLVRRPSHLGGLTSP
jgi:hypothetical protein